MSTDQMPVPGPQPSPATTRLDLNQVVITTDDHRGHMAASITATAIGTVLILAAIAGAVIA